MYVRKDINTALQGTLEATELYIYIVHFSLIMRKKMFFSYGSIIILIALFTVAFKNMSSHQSLGLKIKRVNFSFQLFTEIVMLIICNGNKQICIKAENCKIETFSQMNF